MACYFTQQQQQRQSTPTFSIFDFSPPPNASILHHDMVVSDEFAVVAAQHHNQQAPPPPQFIRSQPQYVSLPTVHHHQSAVLPAAVYYPLSPVMSPRHHALGHHPGVGQQHLVNNNNGHCYLAAGSALPQPPPPPPQAYANGLCDVVTPCCRPRGPPPFFNMMEYRIHELNKRLLQRSDSEQNASLWWEDFATEFFEDDATLTLVFSLEDGPKQYTIGRTLIPRYFRTIYEGGVSELYYVLRYPREFYQNQTNTVVLDCDRAMMVTTHNKPYLTQVHTEGRLICEFAFSQIPNQMPPDDFIPRIRMWRFMIMNHTEFVPKSVLTNPDPAFLQDVSKNITRQGLTTATLNYLRLCVILEPMQELMSYHRIYNNVANPRDCLSRVLFMKYDIQRSRTQSNLAQVMMPPEEQGPRPASKRRKRKGSSSGGTTTPTGSGTGKKKATASPSPAMTSVSMPSSHVDVMVVQEPSMMGGEYGDEDERFITRLENAQFDPAAASAQLTSSGGPSTGMGPNSMVSHLAGDRVFDPTNLGWAGTPQSLHHHPASISSPNTPIGRTTTPANGAGSLHSQMSASPATILAQGGMVGSLTRPLSNQNGSRQSTPNATPTSFG